MQYRGIHAASRATGGMNAAVRINTQFTYGHF
jgi:hypothetical protein